MSDSRQDSAGPAARRVTRRQALALGAGSGLVLLGGGAAVLELVRGGELPGKSLLDRLDGACDVSMPAAQLGSSGATLSGRFYSHARGRMVNYSIAYPPGYRRGTQLPLALYLHGLGGNGLAAPEYARALAARFGGQPLPAFAIACGDGGAGYWHAQPGDDPIAMLLDELVPRCNDLGLGRAGEKLGLLGESMGGYGALLLAERHPQRVAAVAVVGPAIFSSYAAAKSADRASFSSPADFRDNDVVSDAAALSRIPVRIASGASDPFHPAVVALAGALRPYGATVSFPDGCHDSAFFASQRVQSVQFVGERLEALPVTG